MQSDDDQWLCPSFNSYSQTKSAEIAAKVAGEVAGEAVGGVELPSIAEADDRNFNEEDEEDEFEFALILQDELEVFSTGNETIPIFPVFNRDLLNDFESEHEENHSVKVDIATVNVPLRRLFIEERENEEAASPSCSSSEAEDGDEVESIPPGSYCVWKPKVVAPSPSTCKKSKSTGFGSKRWKLRDLLRRSNSEGKDSFVFLTPKRNEVKKNSSTGISKAAKALISSKKSSGSSSSPGSSSSLATTSPTRRMIYSPVNRNVVRGNGTPNRSPKGNGEMPKRKSYLPYRQDLVGFFTTVNSIGRNFSPL